ncbi:MAG TPA: Pycsar system effector family protein [Oligoflexus sp.]|uniref:Pycsar system effector family protein n=1 Tax=Oligoflexus sp. TaxID=1971216 RepID=UPI002D4F9A8F|nr:Pycsar system effector family protein [Oligoflexus sp.]HYX34650.1 Pycsar system effector family protein [Oligoflexus sp.]
MSTVANLRDELRAILENVNKWLQHAESKNGAVITLNGASFFAIKGAFDLDKAGFLMKIYLGFLLFCIVVALVSSLLSFLPQTKISWISSKALTDAKDNVYFFGHLLNFQSNELIDRLKTDPGYQNYSEGEIDVALADQIITNSMIARRKYQYFKFSIWITLFGILTPIGGFLALLKFSPNK